MTTNHENRSCHMTLTRAATRIGALLLWCALLEPLPGYPQDFATKNLVAKVSARLEPPHHAYWEALVANADQNELARMLREYSVEEIVFTLSPPVKWQRPTNWYLFYHYVLPDRVANPRGADSGWRPKVRQKALEILGVVANDYWAAYRFRAWVQRSIAYQTPPEGHNITDPGDVLAYPQGTCGRRNALLVGICRSMGIPARICSSAFGVTTNHVWSEVWVDGRWIVADASGPGFDTPHEWYPEPYLTPGAVVGEGRIETRSISTALHYSLRPIEWAYQCAGKPVSMRASASFAALNAAFEAKDFGTTDRIGGQLLSQAAAIAQQSGAGREIRGVIVRSGSEPPEAWTAAVCQAGVNTLVIDPGVMFGSLSPQREMGITKLVNAAVGRRMKVYLWGLGNRSPGEVARRPGAAQQDSSGRPDKAYLCPLDSEMRNKVGTAVQGWLRHWPSISGVVMEGAYRGGYAAEFESCFCPRCKEAFGKLGNDLTALDTSQRLIFTKATRVQSEWFNWRTTVITGLHREIKAALLEANPRAQYLVVAKGITAVAYPSGQNVGGLASIADAVVLDCIGEQPLCGAGMLWHAQESFGFSTVRHALEKGRGIRLQGIPTGSKMIGLRRITKETTATDLQCMISEGRVGGAAGYFLDLPKEGLTTELLQALAVVNSPRPQPVNVLGVTEEDCLPGRKEPPALLVRLRQERVLPNEIVWQKDDAPMMLVPAGRLLYGPKNEERGLPAFYMDKCEVTNAQFARFAEETGYVTLAEQLGCGLGSIRGKWEDLRGYNWRHPEGPGSSPQGRERAPVVFVSLEDAQWYCRWADTQLPTDEQWQKAARGSQGFLYPWGNDWDSTACPNLTNTKVRAAVVGTFAKDRSLFGIYDMAGNVCEWTCTTAERPGIYLTGGSPWVRAPVAALFRLDQTPSGGIHFGTPARVSWLGFRCCVSLAGPSHNGPSTGEGGDREQVPD